MRRSPTFAAVMKKKPSRLIVAILLLGFVATSPASDHGCQCLLCLANPNGPRAVSECRPPIDKLFRDLSIGKPFPTCDLAQGPNGRSYAEQRTSYFDACPIGTTALAAGATAIQGTADLPYAGPVHIGVGNGDDWSPSNEGTPAAKVCVGNAVGTAGVQSGSGESFELVVVTVYDRLTVLDPYSSPRVIDVYVDDTLYRRVRW